MGCENVVDITLLNQVYISSNLSGTHTDTPKEFNKFLIARCFGIPDLFTDEKGQQNSITVLIRKGLKAP